jgi:hypothetical protein
MRVLPDVILSSLMPSLPLPLSFVFVLSVAMASANELDRSWVDRLEYVGIAVEEVGYHVWGASPVIGPAGRTHLFAARWPILTGFNGWLTDREIARYVSDQPEGPYRFQELIVRGERNAAWKALSPHNPNIQKVGDRYVLSYIVNSGGAKKARVASQRICMLIAETPAGPWAPVGSDGLLLAAPEDPEVWCHASVVGVNNPALFAHPDGRFFLYYKAQQPGNVRRMGVAIAQKVEGPYAFQAEPLTSNESEIEDGYAFFENGKVYLLTTNNKLGSGYLWASDLGLEFAAPIIGYDPLASYIPEIAYRASKVLRGKKFERPQVLLQDGYPTHLFVASGANWTGG